MQVLEIYQDYKEVHEKLEQYLEQFINETNTISLEEFKKILQEIQLKVEQSMNEISEVKQNDQDETNVKDLQYLMADTLFLLMDLIHFSGVGEVGRCRMRCINYLGKRKRTQIGEGVRL